MNEKIKLNKRQPTWNYILNDLALYSLMTKVIHSEEATNQEKFDFMYQIELLQQENARLKDKIEKIEEWLKYKAEALDTFDIPKRKETGAFWFTTRGEIDGLLELLKEN